MPSPKRPNRAWHAHYYEDVLSFGIKYPEAQLENPVAFLNDPWLGNHGRRDAICLWRNEGGLEGFDYL